MKHRRRGYNAAFTDLVFNILVGIVFLFVLAVILINPESHGDVKKNAQYIAELEWPADIDCDVDLWVQDPQGNVVYFRQKDRGIMHIERDDLGYSNDEIRNVDGKYIKVFENKEIWTLRGTVPGEYIVNTHLYACRNASNVKVENGYKIDVPVTIKLMRINPTFEEVFTTSYSLTHTWEERTAFSFELKSNNLASNFKTDQYGLLESVNMTDIQEIAP